MKATAVLIFCVLLSLLIKLLINSYFALPKKELKRRAFGVSPIYKRLNLVAKYGFTGQLFLKILLFIFSAAAIIVASRTLDPLLAVVFLALYAASFKFLSTKQVRFVNKIAAAAAPYFSKLLYYIHPVIELVIDILPNKKKQITTNVYESEDLQDLIRNQQHATNNKIPQPVLAAAINTLEFGSKRVKDFMTAKSKIHFVSASDTVGPILLSELHKTGFNVFPVKGEEDEIVGVLFLHDLATHKDGGKVADFMEKKVMYIRQDKPLDEVLQAFSITGRHDFMVLDDRAIIIGMINLKDVLDQMIEHTVKTGFEDYDNPNAVASE